MRPDALYASGMFVKRNRRASGDKKTTSILLVQGERVPGKRPPGRPSKDAPPPKSRVVHRTLANLSKLPDDLVSLIEAWCRGKRMVAEPEGTCVGPCFGQLGAMFALAQEIGIAGALGESRRGRLAMLLVLARLIHRGSRLSAVRWAEDQAVAQTLGLGSFDEDDLYDALDWLEKEQERIELDLAARRPPATLFLYDVTSSYLEGQKNELAAPGYNRDGKRFKKQIVIGLLTDDQGEPVSIRVYPGNTSDPQTVADQVRFLSAKLGVKDVVFVGDRGMVKSGPKEVLAECGFKFLTALTDPQVRALLKKSALQLDLFDEAPAEVEYERRRFIVRLNPDTRKRDRQRRADQLKKVERKIAERNAKVLASPKAQEGVSLKNAAEWLAMYRLDRFVTPKLRGREVVLEVDLERQNDVEMLDGCYALETDVPKETMDAATAHARYMDLTKVERDFRTMKTAFLEVRPVFLRKAERTRAHAFVTMLALKLTRELERRVKPIEITAQDALDRLGGVRLVTFADPELGLWHLPKRYAKAQREVLDVLPPLPAPQLSRPR